MVVEAPMSGLQIAFWRIALGAAVFSAIVYVSGRRITAAMLRAVAPAGVVISIEIAIFFVALRSTTVANAAVISNLTPLVLLGVASRAFHEKVTGLLVAITGVATIGVALVLFGSSQHTTWQPWGDAAPSSRCSSLPRTSPSPRRDGRRCRSSSFKRASGSSGRSPCCRWRSLTPAASMFPMPPNGSGSQRCSPCPVRDTC